MDKNITLDEYKDIIEKVKAAALEDMKTVGACGSGDAEKSALSLFLLELKCRDPKRFDLEHYGRGEIFTNFASFLEGLDEVGELGMFFDSYSDLTSKCYWRVGRYAYFLNRMTLIYSVYFTFDGEIFSVEPDSDFACYFEQYEEMVRQNIPVSPSLEYILKNRRQLMLAWNVDLSLKPGDKVRVNVRPFKDSFYAVYRGKADKCAHQCSVDPLLKNAGFQILTHPFSCELKKGEEPKVRHLWRCEAYPIFTEDFNLSSLNGCSGATLERNVIFPHTPYDRMKVVESGGKKVEQTDKR